MEGEGGGGGMNSALIKWFSGFDSWLVLGPPRVKVQQNDLQVLSPDSSASDAVTQD